MRLRGVAFATSIPVAITLAAGLLSLGTRPTQALTPTPTFTATPCPTNKVPDTYHGSGCGTPTATPTSQRPYGASLRLIDHFPSPAISGRLKTWVFEVENVGSQYGCGAHDVSLTATMTGLADNLFQGSAYLGCHEGAQITVSSIVTAPPGGTITIDARAYAGASPVMGMVMTSDTVKGLGDFNCDGAVNAIDAALILQISAGLAIPLPCTGDGDVNRDGELNPVDAALVLQYDAGILDVLPA